MMSKKYVNSGLLWVWIAIAVLLIDRYSKVWVVDHLRFQEPLEILPFFKLTLAYNTGAAFSFLHSANGWQNWFLGGLAFVVSAVILIWLARSDYKSIWNNLAYCLILGGALGNAWDRISYGYVIDFLSFHLNSWHFAIFNLADSAICVGAFMLIVNWIREK